MVRTLAIVAAWLAVSALIVVLAVQNRGLRAQRDALADRAQFAYLGMYVPETALTTLDGESVLLGTPGDGHQVVFFFNHTCPYCARSAASVVAAARALREAAAPRASMLGVCLCTPGQARGFVAKHGFDFPVATLEDRRLLALYRARNVPALLAINPDGRVFHAVQGSFDTQTQVDALVAAVDRMPTGSLPGERLPADDAQVERVQDQAVPGGVVPSERRPGGLAPETGSRQTGSRRERAPDTRMPAESRQASTRSMLQGATLPAA